ncbi:MAG: HAD-IIB family hydrolase [Nitrosopumilus sp. D6]|nr:MAG: HAD-IIB family hydrolase [Nitrosopumilus sp. D6]
MAYIMIEIAANKRKYIRSVLEKKIKFKKILPTKKGLSIYIAGNIISKTAREKYHRVLGDTNYKYKIIFVDEKTKKKNRKHYNIFFDIDSTITDSSRGNINSNVLHIFNKMKKQNTSIFFCTGRSKQMVKELIHSYNTSECGIAEAGGIVIGAEKPKYGNREEPDVLIKYLMDKDIKYEIDEKQQDRDTEHVIKSSSITEQKLNAAIKESRAKVECHKTKNTFHITAKGVNKGAAIDYLIGADNLNKNPDIDTFIAVGDSELDFSMFKQCNKSYLVAKPNTSIIKLARKAGLKIERLNPAPKAIKELYQLLYET